MTATQQPQSTPITNAKLSAAQIRCLETMQYGTRPLPLSAKAETQRMNKLSKMGLVDSNHGLYCPEYFLTLDGKETLRALNGHLPEIVPSEETAAELPVENTRITFRNTDGMIEEDDVCGGPVYDDDDMWFLPPAAAKMPVMDADTAPVSEYGEGDTVRFHYFLSNCDSDLYTGRIDGFKDSVRWGKTALIVDITGPNRFHVPPRYVSLERIKGVIAAPVITQEATVTIEDVRRLEKEWFIAQDAPKDFDEAMTEPFFNASRRARIAYLVAYATYHNTPWMMPSAEERAMLDIPSVTPAPVSPAEAVSVSAAPLSPFARYTPIEEDPAILAAKRQGQYEAAKGRIEAVQGVYQAPQRTTPQMHDSAYLARVFGKAE
jgi:hypothetical protein